MRKILKSDKPVPSPVIFEALFTRKHDVADWQTFFSKVLEEFNQKFGTISEDTLEEFQLEKLQDMLMWIKHFISGKTYSRGDARAIEELLANITWFTVAEAEKYRDRFIKMTKKKVSRKRLLLYVEMEYMLKEQERNGEGRNLSQVSRRMKKKYRWSEQERKNFTEAFRKAYPTLAKQGIFPTVP